MAARREELEFMDKLNFAHGAPVEQCWLETHAQLVGTKWIGISKGDGDRVDVRSRLAATELKLHQANAGILRGDVFSANPPLEAVRLLISLMMIEHKVAKQDDVRRHHQSPLSLADEATCVRGFDAGAGTAWLLRALGEFDVRRERCGGELRRDGHGRARQAGLQRWCL